VTLHGGLTPAERGESLRCFTSGTTGVLLATDAASEGLNLHQRCRLVVNLELPWTPLRLEQRIGRVERIGQARRVHAVHLLATDTVEETLVTKLVTRTDRAVEATEQLRDRPSALTHIRVMAESEARRIEQLRRLSEPAVGVVFDGRPPVTIAHRHGHRPSLWGFHVSFADSAAQRVWQTLLGAGSAPTAASPASPALVDRMAALLASTLDGESQTRLSALEAALKAFHSRAAIREHALARSIESERARLSTSLLQRGLFDRRAERALSAQTAVLDEALARCRARLGEIESSAQIVAEPMRLAFALLRR
jgi:hypothetical protein